MSCWKLADRAVVGTARLLIDDVHTVANPLLGLQQISMRSEFIVPSKLITADSQPMMHGYWLETFRVKEMMWINFTLVF